jgi:predicted HAD superfamily hydrolase
MKRDHVSFDVFDTCLIRRCGLPYKIWDLMADKLFDKEDDRGRLSFVGNRSLAEKKVNQRILHPTLSDIYDELDVTQWGFEKEQVMNLEMGIEEQELFPNPEMLKIVDEYREKGFIIAFISYMYL